MENEVCLNETSPDKLFKDPTSPEYSFLDSVISDVVTKSQHDHISVPMYVLAIKLLCEDEGFNNRSSSVSVVDCFSYVLMNIEKLESNVEHLSQECMLAIQSCSKDLAAAYLRLSQLPGGVVVKEDMEEKVRKKEED